MSVGGMRQHSVAVVVGDKRYRIQGLAEGEVCIYSDEDEDSDHHRITMKRGRVVEVEGETIRLKATGSVVMEGTDIQVNGNVTMEGTDIQMNGSVAMESADIQMNGNVAMEGADIQMSGDVAIMSGALTHDGINISSTHRHGGVEPGGSVTHTPQCHGS